MKTVLGFLLALLGLAILPAAELLVYPPVSGLEASAHCSVRVRSIGGEWQRAFAVETACKTIKPKTDAYFDTLAGWTHAYVNFEMEGAVEAEIARANGQPIRTAAVHPRRKAAACAVVDGRALVRLEKSCLVAVDIDGQMDGQDTCKGYKGPPVHTVSIFANPPLVGKPKPGDPGVLAVKPGEKAPHDGAWTTLYFLPVVHDLGVGFPVRAGRQYYLPGDAMVYGTLSSREWGEGRNIRIFGHGTPSGARIRNLTFRNVTVAGKPVTGPEFFLTNEFVDGLRFAPAGEAGK